VRLFQSCPFLRYGGYIIFHSLIDSPIGYLRLATDKDAVIKIDWLKSNCSHSDLHSSDLVKLTTQQFNDYFVTAHNNWSLPLVDCGTEFQNKVWHYLQSIPLGETRYYSDVAQALNSSAQAVGNACRANPFVIIVPCHRVIAKTGLGGYDGQTSGNNMIIKQWLLEHERK